MMQYVLPELKISSRDSPAFEGGGGVSHRKSLWRVWERASQEKFENVDRVVHLRHFRLLKGDCDALDPPLSSDLEREIEVA